MRSAPMDDLFSPANENSWQPLADRMRPARLEDFFGQQHLLGRDKPLRQAIETDRLHSMIFWGPPGTGKTTLARLIAHRTGAVFLTLSAVLAGMKEIRAAIAQAKQKMAEGRPTILFVDEVHRFNKAQQDAFLPHIEDGTLTFIGATTENPSFELNNALLSRARVYVLKALGEQDIRHIIDHALENKKFGLGEGGIDMLDEARELLAKAADGDARRALNFLEIAADLGDKKITKDIIAAVIGRGVRRFDKGGEAFYDQISALHKSVRGSNPDAALYWFARLLDGGCDALYIARRVVRMASEDIGNADPRALQLALNGWHVQERLGSPEGELAIAQAVVYLAFAPKSNAIYKALGAAMKDARSQGSLEVPLHLRNAPTQLMKELGYGRAYRYAHEEPDGYAAGEHYFPEEMQQPRYYYPVERGLELKIRERLEYFRGLDRQAAKTTDKKQQTGPQKQ